MPLSPTDSGDLDELSWTAANLWCVFVHAVLVGLQGSFLLSLPFLAMLPFWAVLTIFGLFIPLNNALCASINGEGVEFWSDPAYAPARPEHAHERWIFINGVAVGCVLVYLCPQINKPRRV